MKLASRTHTDAPSVTISYRTLSAGAAGVALCLVAIGVFVGARAGAAPRADEATLVPITPCRLFDTRPAPDTVGLRSAPLGPGDTHEQPVIGNNGNCTAVPADAVAISLNVTAVNGTADSFLTVYPADTAERPLTSNLNWRSGAPPTPNKVDVKLSADGKLRFYNQAGTVDVIADVLGYYTHSGIGDLQAQLDAADARLTTVEGQLANLTGQLAGKADSATIAPALPDVGGFVASNGTKLTYRANFGTWTVNKDGGGLGQYTLTLPFPNLDSCSPGPYPLVVASASGPSNNASVVPIGCSLALDTVSVLVIIRDSNGVAVDGQFQFVGHIAPTN